MNYRYEASAAPERITAATTEQLLDLWDLTEAQPMSEELPIVRGWIMDELNHRDPDAFNLWHDNEDFLDAWKESPRAYFTPACELFNVVVSSAGVSRVLWGVTVDEAYRRTGENGAKLTFQPILWKTSCGDGRFVLDLVREDWSGTLALGTHEQISAFESEIEHMTVAQLMHARYAKEAPTC